MSVKRKGGRVGQEVERKTGSMGRGAEGGQLFQCTCVRGYNPSIIDANMYTQAVSRVGSMCELQPTPFLVLCAI